MVQYRLIIRFQWYILVGSLRFELQEFISIWMCAPHYPRSSINSSCKMDDCRTRYSFLILLLVVKRSVYFIQFFPWIAKTVRHDIELWC